MMPFLDFFEFQLCYNSFIDSEKDNKSLIEKAKELFKAFCKSTESDHEYHSAKFMLWIFVYAHNSNNLSLISDAKFRSFLDESAPIDDKGNILMKHLFLITAAQYGYENLLMDREIFPDDFLDANFPMKNNPGFTNRHKLIQLAIVHKNNTLLDNLHLVPNSFLDADFPGTKKNHTNRKLILSYAIDCDNNQLAQNEKLFHPLKLLENTGDRLLTYLQDNTRNIIQTIKDMNLQHRQQLTQTNILKHTDAILNKTNYPENFKKEIIQQAGHWQFESTISLDQIPACNAVHIEGTNALYTIDELLTWSQTQPLTNPLTRAPSSAFQIKLGPSPSLLEDRIKELFNVYKEPEPTIEPDTKPLMLILTTAVNSLRLFHPNVVVITNKSTNKRSYEPSNIKEANNYDNVHKQQKP